MKDDIVYGLTDKFIVVRVENINAKDPLELRYLVLDTKNKCFLPVDNSEVLNYGRLSTDSLTNDPSLIMKSLESYRSHIEKEEEAFMSVLFLS